MVGEPAKPWEYLRNPRAVVATGEILVKLLTTAKKIGGFADFDFVRAGIPLLTRWNMAGPDDWAHLSGNPLSIDFQKEQQLANAIREGASELDFVEGGQMSGGRYQALSNLLIANGVTPLFRGLTALSREPGQALAQRAQSVIDSLKDLGLSPAAIANDTSDKLTAFFVDGTYNFTYILFPTAVLQNGAAGSGTCVISSNYDVNTKLLDKKSLINNFLDPMPQTILQSFDINSNSILMDTYGTSLSGKFGIKEDGSALNTVETGYDATYGTFTKFHKFYIKTQIGFLISNYNKDTDELHSVWFYSIIPKPAQIAEPDLEVKP